MKKVSLILIAAMMLALVSCRGAEFTPTSKGLPQEAEFALTSEKEQQEMQCDINITIDEAAESAEAQDIQYGGTEVQWMTWRNAEDLIDRRDYVIIGKITGISFRVLDGNNGLPLREDWREYYKKQYGVELEPWQLVKLHTFYDVEVLTAYKGKPSKTIQMNVMGGLRDYRAEEQLALLKEYDIDVIVLWEEYPRLEIGESYLLLMKQSEAPWAVLGNPYQCLFDLRESLETAKRGISARDIISVFGEEEWKVFEAQWAKAQ